VRFFNDSKEEKEPRYELCRMVRHGPEYKEAKALAMSNVEMQPLSLTIFEIHSVFIC
jgi:hypothetical protein